MLGKLFSLGGGGAGARGGGAAPHAGQSATAASAAAAAPPEPVSSLESVQEDLYTRGLLYPDPQSLLQNRHDQVFPLPASPHLPASAFDYDTDVELDMRDVRVLVLQDGISSVHACLLYDSQALPPPPPPPPPSTAAGPDRPATMAGSSRVPLSPRKPSLGHAAVSARPVVGNPLPDSPQLRQSATFDRRPSLHGRSHSRLESDAQRAYREYADEIAVVSGCIFGNSELLAYRGTSTKVHILPSDPRASPDLSASSSSSFFHDGRGSLGRSSMRSSKLSQSFSSESAALFPHHHPAPPSSSSSSLLDRRPTADRKRVLITRLFPVTLPNDEDSGHATQTAPPTPSANSGYPFPSLAGDDAAGSSTGQKAKKPKQKRTPMYAVALIVSLPQPPPPTPVPSALSASRNAFRGPGSYSDQESFPSSYGSGRRVGWALATAAVGGKSSSGVGGSGGEGSAGSNGRGIGIDGSPADTATASGSVIGATTDLEERMDPITQHWDIIMRALTRLQTVASSAILALLRAVDVSSPEPYSHMSSLPSYAARSSSFSRRRSEDGSGGSGGAGAVAFPIKTPKTNAKLVTLMPNALTDMERIVHEVDSARTRIAVGLRALRVVTGQNRWGIWRDEARRVSSWAASARDRRQQQQPQPQPQPQPQTHQQQQQQAEATEPPQPSRPLQDPFLHNLLTAFLATHTNWLQALSPARYRKRHMMLQSVRGGDDSLVARTIVVSRDKMAARRVVFLLSAFLPASLPSPGSVRVHRPSTSMSWGALSQSPPAPYVVPILKEQSLRRKINRRGPAGGSGRRSSHSRNLSLQGPATAVAGGAPAQRSVSMSVAPGGPDGGPDPLPLAHLHLYRSGGHERRPSDTASIRTTNLPFSGSDLATRKSSAATTATTIAADATVPHFATLQRAESSFMVRSDSNASSSAAADDLMRTLQRGDSSAAQQSASLVQQMEQGSRGGPVSPLAGTGADAEQRNQGQRWGSMLTGFLSGRRRDSASSSVGAGGGSGAGSGGGHSRHSSITSWDPLGRRGGAPPTPQSPVKDARQGSGLYETWHPSQPQHVVGSRPGYASERRRPADEAATGDLHATRLSQDSPRLGGAGDGTFGASDSFRRLPDLNGAFESPVKTTAVAEDGVIDVDIAFPDYIRSFETAVSSPSSSGFLSLSTPGGLGLGLGSGLDAFEQSCRVSVDGGNVPANVAGWLQSYHPDFCLQAIPPQGNLLAQIKESLRTEPLPASVDGSVPGADPWSSDRWVDVSSALVVDLAKLSITRVRYSRLLRPKPTADATTPNAGNGGGLGSLAGPIPTPMPMPSSPAYDVQQLDERFVEEPIVTTDPVLARALERVMAEGVSGGSTGLDRLASQLTSHLTSQMAGVDSPAESSGISTDDSARSSRSASVLRGRPGVEDDEDYDEGRRASRPRYVTASPTALYAPLTPLGLEEVPRTECKAVVLSALEAIVRDVVRHKEGPGDEDSGSGSGSGSGDGKEEPSVLRAAVQAWLESLDAGDI